MVGNLVEVFAAEIKSILLREQLTLRGETAIFAIPNVYAHGLPSATRQAASRVPWVLVSIYNGEQASADSPRSATLHITDMVYDDNTDMQGYRDALNLLDVICRNLYEQSFVADKYEMLYPYQFAVLDDVKYPYFAAGLAVKIGLTGIAPQNRTGGYAYV